MSDNPKKIEPNASLIRYLEETLDLEKYRKSGKKTDQGSSVGSTDEKMRKIGLRIRNNNDAKSRAIDNLFESMANLIYFFEFINTHPELTDKFGDDIQDLLGLTETPRVSRVDAKEAPFSRLIRELIGEEYIDTNFGYRTRLLHILQILINQKSDAVMMKIGEDPTINDMQMRFMMDGDMRRAETWIGYLDKFTGDNKRKPRRVLRID